jgi:hyperosmotically inducible protein
MFRNWMISAGVAAMLATGACSSAHKAPDVSSDVKKSLEQAGLKDVSVSQDRDKGVVSLTGHVASDADKAQAESIAKASAGAEVVANEIAVLPPGDSSRAKTVNSDLDDAIKKNLDAALVQNHLNKHVKFSVKNGVVTLTGKVDSRSARSQAEQVASTVPNVQQVVNELDVRYQRATSSR